MSDPLMIEEISDAGYEAALGVLEGPRDSFVPILPRWMGGLLAWLGCCR